MGLVRKLLVDRKIFWFLMIILGLFCVVFMLYLTPYGMGLVNDSVGYIGGARNILSGNGYSRLVGNGTTRYITNYPPLLSIAIAGVSLLGSDAIDSVWYLNIALFALNSILVGFIVRRMTQNNLLSLIAAGIFMISEPIFVSHSYAMSEPLYIFLFLLSLLILANYFDEPKSITLILSGIIGGLAFLARYVGVSIFSTGVIALILYYMSQSKRDLPFGNKIKPKIIYMISFAVLPLIWIIRNIVVSPSAANRQFIYHPISMDKLYEGTLNFWGWLLPETFGIIEKIWQFWGIVFILLFIALIIYFVKLSLRLTKAENENDKKEILLLLFILAGIVYLATLYISLTFVDASPILEHRILSPFYICLIILFPVLLLRLWEKGKIFHKLITVGIVLALFVFIAEDSIDIIPKLHIDGQGFANSSWKESQLIQETLTLPEGTLFSNKITAIYILTNRPAFIIPSPINPATQMPREGYQEDLQSIKDMVNSGNASVVVFGYEELVNDPNEKQWMDDLSEGLPDPIVYNDGVIFTLENK